MPVIGNAADGQAYEVNREEQLALLDQLPHDLRRLVQSAPVPEDVRNFVRIYQLYGEVKAKELIIATFSRLYPGWEPQLGDEPPRRRRRPF